MLVRDQDQRHANTLKPPGTGYPRLRRETRQRQPVSASHDLPNGKTDEFSSVGAASYFC